MKRRLVILITHPIQYYVPLYRELAERQNIDVHVVFLSDAGAEAYHDEKFGRTFAWDIPMLQGYQYTVLRPGFNISENHFISMHSKSLLRVLHAIKPNAIMLYGYASRMNWVALNWAVKNSVRVLYGSDSNAKIPRVLWKLPVKHVVVSDFFEKVDVFLCSSEVNNQYLLKYGASVNKIVRFPFSIDYDRFSRGAAVLGEKRLYNFAWAGKFVPEKRPQDFVAAFKRIASSTSFDVRASMIGDGEQFDMISNMLDSLQLNEKIELKGFINQMAMPKALQESEALVFTSEFEPYGLIATEAAAAGLALVVADGIGCVGDTVLARPGVNALIYPPGDVDALAGAMLQLLVNDKLRLDMQQASRSIAAEHDIPVAAAIMESVVNKVCARGGGEIMTARVDVAPEA